MVIPARWWPHIRQDGRLQNRNRSDVNNVFNFHALLSHNLFNARPHTMLYARQKSTAPQSLSRLMLFFLKANCESARDGTSFFFRLNAWSQTFDSWPSSNRIARFKRPEASCSVRLPVNSSIETRSQDKPPAPPSTKGRLMHLRRFAEYRARRYRLVYRSIAVTADLASLTCFRIAKACS